MRCVIVASGPSAKGFKPPEGVTVIAVKGAITWLSRCDYWFSLDPNLRSLEFCKEPRPGVRYFMACPPSDAIPAHVTRLERVQSDPDDPAPQPMYSPQWWLWRWHCVLGLCETPGYIHTGNSAWGALGLAYHLGYRDVLLVGVDGTQDARVEGGKPNDLSHLPLLFQSARDQVRLSTISDMEGITKTTLAKWVG